LSAASNWSARRAPFRPPWKPKSSGPSYFRNGRARHERSRSSSRKSSAIPFSGGIYRLTPSVRGTQGWSAFAVHGRNRLPHRSRRPRCKAVGISRSACRRCIGHFSCVATPAAMLEGREVSCLRQNKASDAAGCVGYVGCSNAWHHAENLLPNAQYPLGLRQRSRPRSSTPLAARLRRQGERPTGRFGSKRDSTVKGRAGFAVDRWAFC
jgi:hypothetical protein